MSQEPTPIKDLTDAQILELIEMLKLPSYQNLSRTHDEYLAHLASEARRRNLTAR